MENLMPSKKFKTGNLFEELSAQPTRTTADLLALIKGEPAKVKKVSFEVGIGHPLEEGYKIIAVVDGSPMDETGFVRATVTGLQGNTSYCMRAIVKTEHETIYSSTRFFTTKNTGVLCHTIELNATQIPHNRLAYIGHGQNRRYAKGKRLLLRASRHIRETQLGMERHDSMDESERRSSTMD